MAAYVKTGSGLLSDAEGITANQLRNIIPNSGAYVKETGTVFNIFWTINFPAADAGRISVHSQLFYPGGQKCHIPEKIPASQPGLSFFLLAIFSLSDSAPIS